MSTALYWGLPSHGTCLKRCRTCSQIVVVHIHLTKARVAFADEDGMAHVHQPPQMWVARWVEYASKQRTSSVGRAGMSTDRYAGRTRAMSGFDRARTRGTRVRGFENEFYDCPFTEIDATGEHVALGKRRVRAKRK